jgi:glyoxylase-like metal-dependent hydrolase (beta-lactamase superfamily II)
VHAWLPDGHATWGMANCVLVTGKDAALLVDTPYTAAMTTRLQRLASEVVADSMVPSEGRRTRAGAGAGACIGTVVNTHGNGDHSYGNGLFPQAEIISTEANGAHLCAEPSPGDLARLVATSDPGTPLGAYVKRHFGRYGDFGGLETVHPNRTFSGELVLDVGGVTVRLIEVGPAHTVGDLIVHLPDEGVVCAGDVVFGDDHPVHWAGPIEEIHRATTRVLECAPRVVVPGHGPLMTPADVRAYADYLLELRDVIHAAYGAGRPLAEVCAELVAGDSRPHWGLTERMAILAAIEYRALEGDATPPNLVRLVDFAAGFVPEGAAAAGTASVPPSEGPRGAPESVGSTGSAESTGAGGPGVPRES